MSDVIVTLPTLTYQGRTIKIYQDEKFNYRYYISLSGKNNHVTYLRSNSKMLLKWAKNVARIFNKKIIIVVHSRKFSINDLKYKR